jgi:hypothetical protein
MAGLDPAIQTVSEISSVFLDGRIKCGQDNRGLARFIQTLIRDGRRRCGSLPVSNRTDLG